MGPRLRREVVRDWGIAVAVAGILVVTGVSGGHGGVWGVVLLALGGLVLGVRRRAPLLVLGLAGVCAVGAQAAGMDVPAVAYLVAVYTAMRSGHRWAVVVGSIALLLALPFADLVADPAGATGEAFKHARSVLEIGWLVAAGAAGEALRQAERRADEAERTREETARRRANEERLHIARELHDSLTHQISVIKVQAEAAVHLARKRGEEVPAALLAIREAGREATRELRATLGALRDDDVSPPRGIEDLRGLVEQVKATGLDATLTIRGEGRDVPAAVERTAYRIVQESLTNVTRHAAAAKAEVRLDFRPDALDVRVDDDGTATPAPTPGFGLLGMRERVTALGGRLRAEPRTGGGFTVHAELPVERTP
ncbi:sensor histidine kinase [Saccharothrix variisporea]|uniref:histidine kinase n=1 Tax=Saccharothrix variisporea TaxID=543527 RepID=A0A495X4S1_9PSEU|nr:histidine kinase [Saccharothrix variisporea]RKT67623.1 signal transduction histidine kinase [Saccharothrix variisporea]